MAQGFGSGFLSTLQGAMDTGKQLVPLDSQSDDSLEEVSPSKKARQSPIDDDPNQQLEELLREHSGNTGSDMMPAWAASLRNSCETGFLEMRELFTGIASRLNAVEQQAANPPPDPRIDALSARVDELSRLVTARDGPGTRTPDLHAVPPPKERQQVDPWAAYLANQARQGPVNSPSSWSGIIDGVRHGLLPHHSGWLGLRYPSAIH